jgi:hypothetical protein
MAAKISPDHPSLSPSRLPRFCKARFDGVGWRVTEEEIACHVGYI